LGYVYLDRVEALSLLKELITLGIVQPTFVSIGKNEQGTFNLTLKVYGNIAELRSFLNYRNLVVSENAERGTCTITTVSKCKIDD